MQKATASSAAELTDDEILARARARRRPDDTFSDADQALLIEYHSDLGCAFERSVSGAVLEFQKLASATSRRCGRCRGLGVLERGGFDRVETPAPQEQRKRDGKPLPPIFDATKPPEVEEVKDRAGASWCPRCRGLGRIDVVDDGRQRCEDCWLAPALRAPEPGAEPELDDAGEPIPPQFGPYELLRAHGSRARYRRSQCRTCCGMGESPTIDVPKPQPSSAAIAVDGWKLETFARVSRRIGRIRAHSPLLADALAVLFGDLGSRTAPKRGRTFALCHLTSPGQRLAKDAEKWVRDRKARRKKPLTRKEAAERLRWRNPPSEAVTDPFGLLEQRAAANERRTRERLERELAVRLSEPHKCGCDVCAARNGIKLGVAGLQFIGPIRRRREPARKPRKLRRLLDATQHPRQQLERPRERDAVAELDALLEPEMSVQDRIGWVADLLAPEPAWRPLLDAAKSEARALERRVAIAWNRSGGLRRDELAALVRIVQRAEDEGLEDGLAYIQRHAGGR